MSTLIVTDRLIQSVRAHLARIGADQRQAELDGDKYRAKCCGRLGAVIAEDLRRYERLREEQRR